MNARVYECEVMHRRLKPRQRAFTYRLFMLEVDIDTLPDLARGISCLGHNGFNLYSIDDLDHINLGLPGGIRPNLIEWLARHDVVVPDSAVIRLVTFPRVMGYGFNPVSFYYLNNSDGTPLFAVAEVVNTFREMKLYVVDSSTTNEGWHRRMAKDFYVSPFSDPGDSFDFRLGIPADEWRVNIDDHDADGLVLVSSIRGVGRELTSWRLFGYAFKYPLLSLKIIGLIHWHALLMWFRRLPYHRKTERREAQLEVLRPHSSLNTESSS